MAKVYEDETYSIAEAARKLNVSPSTIWRWIDAGRLPAFRIGPRKIRIRQADLEAMVTLARPDEAAPEIAAKALWAGYDPAAVEAVLSQVAGSWADMDTDAWIERLYWNREAGSRPDVSA